MRRKPLRHGYTTGACAAAAAKGAALMLRDRILLDEVEIILPCGETARFRLHGQVVGEDSASCFVVKDAGDDPDVTNGAEIHATVTMQVISPSPHPSPTRGEGDIGEDPALSSQLDHRLNDVRTPPPLVGGGRGEGRPVLIEGGVGVGRVTKPGLAVPVGEWAINPVPRKMITQAVCEVFTDVGAIHELPLPHVTVSIPNGQELAKKTLNARLGIIGGLSILGTTGIVKPVSAEAWTDTIDAAIDVALACGCETIVLSTGRTSEVAAQRFFNANTPTTNLPALTPPPPSMGGGRGEGENAVPAKLKVSPSPHPSPIKGEGAYYEESFVMMGDHVGYAVRACVRKGVKSIIVAGQFAKLLKIACGHEQTHVSSSRLDFETLAGWLNDYSLRLGSSASEANTAREVLEKSGSDPELISLVCGRAVEFVGQLAPGLGAKVFLAGYGGEVLYYGPNQR